MKKRILSMFLMLTMVISLIVVPGTSVSAINYYDTVDTDCELAVDVLSALGIMGGYTDGSFLPYNTITRAEMVSIAVKLAGIEGYSDQSPDDMELFNDMYDYDGWAAGVVAIAKAAGIARSDENGNFNPDMSATYEDAMQMVVSALGYAHQAVSRGGELMDYVYVAQRLGLTKKLNTAIGQNITRGDVAKLVYAALTVDLMEAVTYSTDGTATTYEAVEGKNALNTYFDVYEINGIITENEYAAIDGDTTVEEKQILINGEAFSIGATDVANYLGYYATVYALEDDDETIKTVIAYSIKSVKNNTITIPAENIVDVTYSIRGYNFEYWANMDTDRRTKDVTTSATPRVLYNGKAEFDVTVELLKPEYGEVVLIDNNGDDEYDIIDIWEYELVYVFSVSQVSGNVVGYYDRNRPPYKFDPTDEDYHVTFLNAYGGAAQLSDIKQYSVLYVYESTDGLEKKVVVSNNKVSGSVTEASPDSYVINGTEYELSPAVVGRVELAVSDSGDYHLDADNRIAGFKGTTVIRRNIGMFIAVNDGGLKRGYQMKVLTANSGVQIYDIASSVMVNGIRMSSAEIYGSAYSDALFGQKTDDNNANGAGLTRPHPARSGFLYKLNTNNEICEMTVVGEGSGDGFLQVRKVNEKKPNYYSRGYNCLHHSDEKYNTTYNGKTIEVGKRTYCDNSTINFVSDEALSHTNDNQSFYTKAMTSYSDNFYFDNFDYMYAYYYSPDAEPIDMQTTVCNFLVTEDWYDGSVDSTEDAEPSVDASQYQDNTAIKFIYKITQANDKTSGDPTVRVYYFDGTNIRNALVRPQYEKTAHRDSDASKEYYPNGFPVRIAFDGSYIEEIAPFFGSLYDGADMWTMVKPIFNASTGTNIMPIMPFFESQWRAWASWSSGTQFESRYDCGIVTSIDEVVGRKLFSVAHITGINSKGGNGQPADYSTGILLNERLEGTVYRVNFDRDGYVESFKKGSLDDVSPGQLVLVRRRMYDSGSSKWTSLNRYGIYEIYILSEDASELDYLKDFYDQVQREYVNE